MIVNIILGGCLAFFYVAMIVRPLILAFRRWRIQ